MDKEAPIESQPQPLEAPPPYTPSPGVSYIGAPAAPPPAGQNVVIVQQVVVPMVFPKEPVRIVCKFCGKRVVTEVKSNCLWGRLFTCIFCAACLIVVGVCVMSSKNCSCQETVHTCPECKKVLGKSQ